MMSEAIIVFLYFAGMVSTAFLVVERPRIHVLKAAVFLTLWPIFIPYLIAYVIGAELAFQFRKRRAPSQESKP